MQVCKRETKFRTTKNPEVLLVNSLLLSVALQDNLNKFSSEVAEEEVRCKGTESNPNVLGISCPDTEAPEATGEFMLGHGTKPLKARLLAYKEMFNSFIDAFEVQGWTAEEFSSSTLLLYKRLALRGSEIVHSISYKAASSRRSYYCLIRFREGEEEVFYIAKILDFILIKSSEYQHQKVLRLACCDLFKTESQDNGLGRYYSVKACSQPTHRNILVAASLFDHKLIFCNLTAPQDPQYRTSLWIFVPYSNVQSYTDVDDDWSTLLLWELTPWPSKAFKSQKCESGWLIIW